MKQYSTLCRVGDIRPSQLMFAFGIGAVVDLPNLSAMVMGLEDWDITHCREIAEERLLVAVREEMGTQVERLLSPPEAAEPIPGLAQPFDDSAKVGVPVAPFPRWVVCPRCRLLAPLSSGLFKLQVDHYRSDRTRYVHENCQTQGRKPTVIPARFLAACEHGHLDDFPWVSFVHRGDTSCRFRLRLREFGLSGEASGLQVECETCGKRRRMIEVFEEEGKRSLPACRGRRPHLRDFEEGCDQQMQAILLGASNSWFPVTLSALSVPTEADRLPQLVTDHWSVLSNATSREIVAAFRQIGQLRAFAAYLDEQIWEAIRAKREGETVQTQPVNLRVPEWGIFSNPDPERNTADFRLRRVEAPRGYERILDKVVLVERLREVEAFLGFTRMEAPGEPSEYLEVSEDNRVPISRHAPRWVPAAEVRGEGLFLQLAEEAIQEWQMETSVLRRARRFREAHRDWRRTRGLPDVDGTFPGPRYILLHSFAHALMRQLALECGYGAASISERIYSLSPEDENGPMAGMLLYTAASDSEGTLGGLVSLGEPQELRRHISQALETVRICASDPLCASHDPTDSATAVHGAACHACLFLPETSCERGNRYLDRSVLVPTLAYSDLAFFPLSD